MTSPRFLRLVRRRLHQLAAVPAPSRRPALSNDYIHAVYQDLMMLDQTPQPAQVQPNLEGVVLQTEHQRDLQVKSHIVSAAQHFPADALALLHKYETSGHFAPIKSYTRVISALFNVKTCPSSQPGLGRAAAHAHAWDLFAHMRYVAHPVPDAHLYALMIRACGSFSRPEPERALDLWMEMQENGVKPTKGAYEAIIRVCGKAGPEWVGEGMRLAREMSDQYSISGISGRGLWCALLEGCKRAGDLQKARWVLAEAVRGSDVDDSVVDAELMMHLFHAYASYKVPFRRQATRLVQPSEVSDGQPSAKDEDSDAPSGDISVEESVPSFSRLPPQTSSDVIAETRALFDRILQDRHPTTDEAHQSGLLTGRLAHVDLTPALVNAYLSVFYRHASIETSRQVFDSLFSESHTSLANSLHADEHTCINALERCAMARAEERHVASRWAEDVWRRWEAMETNGLSSGKGDVGSFARLIERAHTAMRRVLVLSGDLDGALMLLRAFVSRYPPNAVTLPSESRLAAVPVSASTAVEPFSKPQMLSTRTVLTNSTPMTARPLVRLTSAITPKDDRVPPIIAFSDVELMHTRLAEHGRIKDLGYIKWVCMAYSHALKKRRKAVIGATPTRDEEVVVD